MAVRVSGAVRWRVVAAVIGMLALVAALLALIVYLPQRAIDSRSQTDWLKAVQDLRTSLLQGLGGAALLGTLYFSARTLQLNRRGQVTERFTKAIEQLGQMGPEKLAVRLGGIYALEQIALDSHELHWPVVEVLTAFLRENSATHSARSVIEALEAFDHGQPLAWDPDDSPRMQPELAADLQAIATVLSRRPDHRRHEERKNNRTLNLSGVWLPKARLAAAHLERANLAGAHLEWSSLQGAHLEGAVLSRARMWGAELARAQLAGANLSHAHLHGAILADAHLEGSNLRGAHLERSGLGDADMEDADLRDAHLEGAHLRRAVLDGANLRGAHLLGAIDLTREHLTQACIDGSTVLPSYLQEGSDEDDPDRR
jgi:uncharacterized protein YjbI with pentapeptide repeats